MHRAIKTFNLIAVYAATLIVVTAIPVAAQFAKWPAGDETGGPLALRAYGSGVIVPALREAAIEFGRQKGVIVNITAGPVQTWKKQAIQDADLIFADSEQMMNTFVQRDLPAIIDPMSVRTLSLHPSGIVVRTGNPKGIKAIKDLCKPGIKILVVAPPEGGGMWEEAAKSEGGDTLVEALRPNIGFYTASTVEAKAVWLGEPGCDAWLDLTPGHTKSPQVITAQENAIYRACAIAVTNRSTQRFSAEEFAAFIESPEGQAIFFKRSAATQ